jgi:Tol biopolymer transport system component
VGPALKRAVTLRWIALAGLLAFVGAGAARQERGPQAATRVGLILFWSDTPWPSLWSIRPDGSHRRRVFRTHQNCKRPVLSPNRRWIAFDGTPPGQRPLSQFDIQVVRRDGTGRRTLVPYDDVGGTWSPDGKRIVFTSRRFRLSHLFVMRANGREEHS